MNEKYLLAIGAGLIIISFGMVVYFGILAGFGIDPEPLNENLSFEQLEELNYETREKILENPTVEQFRDLVGEGLDQVKEKIGITKETRTGKP